MEVLADMMTDVLNGSLLDERRRRTRNRWLFVLKIAISFGLLGLILYFVDYLEFVDVLASMNPWYMLALIALINVDRVLMAYKWSPLLGVFSIRIPLIYLIRVYSVAPLAGMAMPSSIGGDLFRIYSLSRYKVNKSAVMASMIVERGIGVAAILVPVGLSVVVAIFLLRNEFAEFNGVIWTAAIGVLLAAVATWSVYRVSRRGIDRIIEKISKYPLLGKFAGVYLMLKKFEGQSRTIAFVFALTVVEQMLPLVTYFLIVRALGVDVSILEIIAIVPVIVLALRLPISIDGIGVQEGLIVGLFALAGVSAAEALLMSVSARVITVVAAAPWTIYYIIGRHDLETIA